MKHVCYISGLKRASGGIESYLSIMQGAANNNFRFSSLYYTLSDSSTKKDTPKENPLSKRDDTVQKFPIRINDPGDVFTKETALSSYHTLQSLHTRENIDLLHIHAPNTLFGALAASYAKNNGIPIVATYHYAKVRDQGHKERCTRQTLENADKIIGVSNASKDTIESIIGPNDKTVVFYNAIDTDRFSLDLSEKKACQGKKGYEDKKGYDTKKGCKDTKRDETNASSEDDKLLSMIYPAAICIPKGHLDLVEIIRDVYAYSDKISITLLGRVPPGDATKDIMRQQIMMSAADPAYKGLEKVFSFKDPIPYKSMPKELQKHDVLVFPSHEEGFGLISIEAQACGLPVVAYDVGGIPETLKDGKTGFLVPFGDTELFADHLISLIKHKDLLKTMGDDAAQFVKENKKYHSDTLIKQHLELYDSLI